VAATRRRHGSRTQSASDGCRRSPRWISDAARGEGVNRGTTGQTKALDTHLFRDASLKSVAKIRWNDVAIRIILIHRAGTIVPPRNYFPPALFIELTNCNI
jgi:hypothetical protein